MDEAAKHAARHGEEESHIAHKARRYEETSDGAADEEPTTVLDEADEALEGILTDVSTQTKEQPQGPLHKIYLRKARTSPHKLTINGQSLRRAEQKTQEFRDIEERRLAAATVRSAWRT